MVPDGLGELSQSLFIILPSSVLLAPLLAFSCLTHPSLTVSGTCRGAPGWGGWYIWG